MDGPMLCMAITGIKLDDGHSIECKLTPATRSSSTEVCYALCDPVTLNFDLLI